MSLRSIAFSTAAVLAFASSNASPEANEFKPSAGSWAGVHAGLHVGYGSGVTKIGDGGTPLGPPGSPPYGAFACGPALTGNYCDTPMKLDPRGALAGGDFGIDWQAGSLVYGLGASATWLGLDQDKTLVRPFADRDIASTNYDWMAALTGRIGVTGGRSLFYLRGGAAFARARFSAADLDFDGTNFNVYTPSLVTPSRTMTGWTIGAGFEYAIDARLSLRAEYMHTEFRSFHVTSADGDIYRFSNRLDTVTIGLKYRLP